MSRCDPRHFFVLALRIAITVASVAVSSGCFFLHKSPVLTRSFVIAASADANDNAPTTVDAVMIYNATMMPTVLGMTAKQWFDRRDQLKNDFPSGFEIREWEVAHGLRDGKTWPDATADQESYDLIVVGGGISGLAAAYFFRKFAGPQSTILIVDNHDFERHNLASPRDSFPDLVQETIP